MMRDLQVGVAPREAVTEEECRTAKENPESNIGRLSGVAIDPAGKAGFQRRRRDRGDSSRYLGS